MVRLRAVSREEASGRNVGRGLSTDIIEASVNAYLKALNKLAAYEARLGDESTAEA